LDNRTDMMRWAKAARVTLVSRDTYESRSTESMICLVVGKRRIRMIPGFRPGEQLAGQ
jgi:hypothetical protein